MHDQSDVARSAYLCRNLWMVNERTSIGAIGEAAILLSPAAERSEPPFSVPPKARSRATALCFYPILGVRVSYPDIQPPHPTSSCHSSSVLAYTPSAQRTTPMPAPALPLPLSLFCKLGMNHRPISSSSCLRIGIVRHASGLTASTLPSPLASPHAVAWPLPSNFVAFADVRDASLPRAHIDVETVR